MGLVDSKHYGKLGFGGFDFRKKPLSAATRLAKNFRIRFFGDIAISHVCGLSAGFLLSCFSCCVKFISWFSSVLFQLVFFCLVSLVV